MNSLVVALAVVACLVQTALGSGWAVAPYVGAHYAGAHYAAPPYVGAHYAGYTGYPGAHYYGYNSLPYSGYYPGYAGHYGPRYHGPLAVPVVLPSGYLADTPEVAAAKGAHLTAGAHAKAATGAGYAGAYGHGAYGAYHGGSYHGPLAVPVVLPNGYLADTPEVAAAKGAHFNAVAHAAVAAHRSGYGYGWGYHH